MLKNCLFKTYFLGPTCEVQLTKKSCGFKGLVICVIQLKQFFKLGFLFNK